MIDAGIVSQEAKTEMETGILECGRNATGLGFEHSDHKCSNYNPYMECVWLRIVEVSYTLKIPFINVISISSRNLHDLFDALGLC